MKRLSDQMNLVVCIAGPTASGKSAWAIEIAKAVDGEIINADSMQVYKELQILSARPGTEEMEDIPHHLFGYVPASHRYSAGQWTREATDQIIDCLARGKVPILVGGTGLYFKALTEGLASIPAVDKIGMDRADGLLKAGIDKLRKEAENIDPVAAARVLGNDPQRLHRIVAVAAGTANILSEWQKDTKPVIPNRYWQGAVMLPERDMLYERINARFEIMLEDGGLDEAKAFHKLRLPRNLPAAKAIGVTPLLNHLDGKISYDEAVSQAKRDTRRFAKRQFTWFRGQAKHWFCVKNNENKLEFRKNILKNVFDGA
ncbi:MAG: tRNA (adenosine(37)-N6)-dimethylallyltransferase MiaA [Hellea sp.]|nr:tRNA (adenosine(37)-N6)-dimethylallyltransferase MiaA [Hellea sp.]